ncbi:MAG: hypothetical protein J6X86_07270 [Bacteroidales bacterium]|nr:hypothetical protein [Bacteroidales bacterium]
MEIDNNSYYIRYKSDEKFGESATFTHYIEVWDNGYALDIYNISRDVIDWEDASHTGIDPNKVDVGKRILRRYYDRWEKRNVECDNTIEQMVKKCASPYNGNLAVGDCLYIPIKEIHIAEYLEEFEEDISDDFGDSPDFRLVHVTSIDPVPQGDVIFVDEYWTENKNEPFKEYVMEYVEKSMSIPKEVFDRAANLITKITTEILAEIKQMYEA